MFINTPIYFEQKYFLRYGITFWFLLQVLLQEVTTICMLFVKRFVNQIHFYFYKKKCKFREISRSVLPLMSQNAFEMTLRYDQMHYNHSIYSIIRAR